MRALSESVRRLGVLAAGLCLVLTGATPALADDTAPPDTTPPVVVSTGLTAGQIVPRQPVLHVVATDDVGVAYVMVLVGPNIGFHCTGDATQGYSCPLTIPTGMNGEDVDLTVRAFDAARNHGDLTTTVHVISVALAGTLAPAAGTPMRSGPMTATLSDVSSETTEVDMTDGLNGAVLATLTSAPWTFSWNATETATPPCFRLSDPYGNVTTYCSKYIVSDEPPTVAEVSDFNNVWGSWVWGSRLDQGNGWIGTDSTIYTTITDKTGIAHSELWVDGVLKGTSTAQSPSFGWHDATPKKTSANVELRVTNRLGLTTTTPFRLNIDNAGPVLKVSPGNGALVRGTRLTVSRTATDQHQIFLPLLGDRPLTSPVLDLTDVALKKDGPISLSFSAYDMLGNRTELDSTVIVDNTAPALTITSAPKNGAKVKGTVTVKASATDKNGINRVELLINGKIVAKDVKAGYSFAINTKKYGKTIKIQLRAYDKAGNARTTTTRTWHRS